MSKGETIGYDANREVWCLNQGTGSYPLHCGESFDLAIGSSWLPCRLELDSNWYVIMKETKFILHPRAVYTVRM